MADYTFRIADESDTPTITSFMNTHWGSMHPLINFHDFFSYYYETSNTKLNFVLAENQGNIAAIAGFIPSNSRKSPDIWVSIWLADKTQRGSGLELMAALPQVIGARNISCNNIRPETRPFYEFLGYSTGRINHFYRLSNLEEYSIAKVTEKKMLPSSGNALLKKIETPQELAASGFLPPENQNPYKDTAYLCKRYYKFPHQHYNNYLAYVPGNNLPKAFVSTRITKVKHTAALRITDFVGEQNILPQIGNALAELMLQANAEYADIYCAGISTSILNATGFVERLENDPNIIPTYLTPPLFKNIDFYYFTSNTKNFTIFKADGDQDRPNIQ